jgi:DNA-binding GntR family transcriptional regulator
MANNEDRVAQAPTLSDIAYRAITRKLMASELLAGQKLSEQKIAAECGISRTPVREAVRRLIEEGVLYQIPCSGTYVARLDRRQLIDAYEVRMALECFALDRAVRNLTREQRAECRQTCDVMRKVAEGLRKRNKTVLDGKPLVTFLKADLSFHLLLLKAAGNALAIKIVTHAYQRNLFFGHYSHRRDLNHVAWAWHHHAEIERAIRRGDADRATRWMRTHIARSREDALIAFDQAQISLIHANHPLRDPVHEALDRFASQLV